MTKEQQIEEILSRGVMTVMPSREELKKILLTDRKIKLYLGVDPTGPDLHIGHLTGLMKLRQFQKLGHEVIFLIGDFTATIGDPSGKSDSRPILSKETVNKNALHYKQQAGRVLDFEGDNPVVIKRNSEWLSKLGYLDFLKVAHFMSIQQVIKRDMFQKRLSAGKDLFLSEFFYPLLQGYDSVAMEIDLEIGGNDQLFNMMIGRDLMHKMIRKDKFVMTLPLLTDANGQKIGKTEGNVIALDSDSKELYSTIMNFSDDLIVSGLESLTEVPMEEINRIRISIKNGENPMKFKKLLAFNIVKLLDSEVGAKKAEEAFENTFQKRQAPDAMPVFTPNDPESQLTDVLVDSKTISSRAEAKRMILQGAIEIDGQIIKEPKYKIEIDRETIIKVGKRTYLKVKG